MVRRIKIIHQSLERGFDLDMFNELCLHFVAHVIGRLHHRIKVLSSLLLLFLDVALLFLFVGVQPPSDVGPALPNAYYSSVVASED